MTLIDHAINAVDTALSSVFADHESARVYPAQGIDAADLTATQRKHIAGLMRVNHAGEISAQGLYQGQALTAKLPDVREKMEEAAAEEVDHLAWCETRLSELGEKPSIANPLWYAGSFCIGALAGLAGDKWSLGFVAETEHQVVRHLSKHMKSVPQTDHQTQAILAQMKADEAKHASMARDAGGAELPLPIKMAMSMVSKIMTTIAYRV